MIAKVRRDTYNAVVAFHEYRKALAFAILIKTRRPASVIPEWSYRELSRISDKSVGFCKKAVAALRRLHLVREERRNGRRYLVFKKLRMPKVKNRRTPGYHATRFKDVDISKLDCSSFAVIDLGLRSMLIVEIQARKNWASQLISSKRNPKSAKQYNRAKRVCRKRGYGDDYSERGLSYTGIARRLRCGRSTVSKAIDFGEWCGLFRKLRMSPQVWDGIAPNPYYSRNGEVYYQPVNKYYVLNDNKR